METEFIQLFYQHSTFQIQEINVFGEREIFNIKCSIYYKWRS